MSQFGDGDFMIAGRHYESDHEISSEFFAEKSSYTSHAGLRESDMISWSKMSFDGFIPTNQEKKR